MTLTATVSHGSSPVSPGLVVFCDADAMFCEDAAVFGQAQLTVNGTATTTLVLGVGSYNVVAVFQGNSSQPKASSLAQSLVVTGNGTYSSFSTIAASGGAGNYTLTSDVSVYGVTAPSGSVSFLDTSNNNFVVGTASLDPATLGLSFSPATGLPQVGIDPFLEVVGDFNHDGKLDLAITHYRDDTIGVMLGNGDGTFRPETPYSAGQGPYGIATGDFNGDGNLDLVVANYSYCGACAATVGIFLGNGDGTFQPQQSVTIGTNPIGVAVADFNGDGNADVALLDNIAKTLTVLLGNGDGTFYTLQTGCPSACMVLTFPVGDNPTGVATGDFNGDGQTDLAVSNTDNGTISIFLGNGDGTFQSQPTSLVGSYPVGIVAGDFNQDGFSDLAVANANNDTVSVLLANGDGTFQAQVLYAAGNWDSGITAGDVNGDKKIDLVTSNKLDNTISLLVGAGDGTFAAQSVFPVGNAPLGIVSGDFDDDGSQDVAITNTIDNTISVLLGRKKETASASGVSVPGIGIHNILASYSGDIDRAPSRSNSIPLIGSPLATTSTSLNSSLNPATVGQTVTFTATVTPIPAGTPTGSVSFYDGSNLLSTLPLEASGIAAFPTSLLASGSHSVTARYSGNGRFAASVSSALDERVIQASLTKSVTGLTGAPNPAFFKQTVVFTATVAPVPTGAVLGTVSFICNSKTLGIGAVSSSGVSTFTTSSLAVGSNDVIATYSGNANLATSSSAIWTEKINEGPSFLISAPRTPVTLKAGGSANVNVSIEPVGGGFDNEVTMSTSALPAGVTAMWSRSTMVPGLMGASDTLTLREANQTSSLPRNSDKHWPFTSTGLTALCLLLSQRKRSTGSTTFLALFVILMTASLTGCAGGLAPASVSQPGSYPITITGSSGSIHADTTITLIVQ